jgi:hypothetical protein
VFLNQRAAEFSFFTPSAPPLTYTFKLTGRNFLTFQFVTSFMRKS